MPFHIKSVGEFREVKRIKIKCTNCGDIHYTDEDCKNMIEKEKKVNLANKVEEQKGLDK